MTSNIRFFIAALAGILVCSAAGAQTRNAATPARQSFTPQKHAGRVSASSTSPVATGFQSSLRTGATQISSSGRINSGFVHDQDAFTLESFSGVPGLGFDFPHLAAIRGAPRNNPGHFGRGRHHGQGLFTPILFGGYPYAYDDLSYDQQDQQQGQQSLPQSQSQPRILVIEQPVPAQQSTNPGSDGRNFFVADSASQPVAQIPDVGNFIFIRRDGRILFASLFSVVGGQLQYVTPEGIRHTLAISDLDTAATQQMNEARGTAIQIHN